MNPEQLFENFPSDMFHHKEPEEAKQPYFLSADGQLMPASASFQPSSPSPTPRAVAALLSAAQSTPQPGPWVSFLLEQRKEHQS